jgi:hypothetical protein
MHPPKTKYGIRALQFHFTSTYISPVELPDESAFEGLAESHIYFCVLVKHILRSCGFRLHMALLSPLIGIS